MSWIITIVIAVLTGVLGLVAAGAIANAAVGWYRISSFEGASGYFVVGIALAGAVAGLIIGLIAGRLTASAGGPAFFKGIGLAFAATGGIAGIAALLAWSLADVPPEIGGLPLDLEVEIRLPASDADPPASRPGEPRITLGSVANHVQRNSQNGEVRVADSRMEDGRWIVPGTVPVFTQRGKRSVDLELGGRSVAGFLIPLPRRPGSEYERWSDWLPKPRAGSPAWPDSKPSYRFRVQRRVPPPPPPDPAEAEVAEFAALDPAGPLESWLRFLDPYGSAERSGAVMEVVAARPADLARAIGAVEESTRERALKAVTLLRQIDPEVAKAVLGEQRRIVADMRRFLAMTEEDEGYYDLGNALRSRFSDWHRAWWSVHRLTGVDGRPPVQEILDLARTRPADGFLQEIEVNGRAHLEGIDQPAGAQ